MYTWNVSVVVMIENCMVVIEGEVCGKQAVATYRCLIGIKGRADEEHDIHVCEKHKRHFEENNI